MASDLQEVLFVFGDELTPLQQGSLERALDGEREPRLSKKQKAMARQALEMDPTFDKFEAKRERRRRGKEPQKIRVSDRTAVVLSLFAKRARTSEGRLQTALATTLYRMPRASMARGLRDEQLGSTKTERRLTADVDRKTLVKRAALLRKKIQHVKNHRDRTRKRRSAAGLPVVALIGYTNAGKSSLFKALFSSEDHLSFAEAAAGDDNLVIDGRPFATLDPLTRRVTLHDKRTALVTDTVGFVSKLPAAVSAAFRATLEEVRSADVLVHVVDASASPHLLKKRATVVDRELDAIFAEEEGILPPRVFFYNKIDALDDTERADRLRRGASGTSKLVVGSCHTREGVDDLRRALTDALDESLVPIDILVPHSEAAAASSLVADLRSRGRLSAESSDFDGTYFSARAPFDLANKLLRQFSVRQQQQQRRQEEDDGDEE